MYDRDYVKTLERDIEIEGRNRFDGWSLGSEREIPHQEEPSQRQTGPLDCEDED